jgi:hypothetical protein
MKPYGVVSKQKTVELEILLAIQEKKGITQKIPGYIQNRKFLTFGIGRGFAPSRHRPFRA